MLCSYQQLYNALPDLGKSSSYIQEDKFQAFCKEISQLAETYGLLDVLCIRLAHKHWSLAPDQIMYERDGHFKGQQASVTSPVPQQSLKEPYVPTWWLHSNGNYEGAEFTSDPRIIALYDKINAQPECLRQFLKIATTFGYQDYLVPGILTNTSSNTICVEHNVEGQSYVTEEEISQDRTDQTQSSASVPTTWELICPVRVRGNCPRFEGCISIYTPVEETQGSDSAVRVRGNCPRTEGCISIYTSVEETQGSGSVARVRGNCPRVEGCISIYTPVDEE